MRVVQREQAEKMNAKKHKRKEMFPEARPKKRSRREGAIFLAQQMLSQDTSDHTSVPSTALPPVACPSAGAGLRTLEHGTTGLMRFLQSCLLNFFLP